VGKRKVTLDTNILVSALGWKGNPHKILKVIDGELDLFISSAQSEEPSRVLDYPKFGFTEEQKGRSKRCHRLYRRTLIGPDRACGKSGPNGPETIQFEKFASLTR
jgi:hypothetical protein